MNTKTPVIIVSADDAKITDAAQVQSRRTWFEHKLQQLQLNYRKVTGKYKFIEETSFLVLVENEAVERAVYRLAKAFGQETVLFIDANNYAALFDADGNYLRAAGQIEAVTESQAKELGSYTFVDGIYYAAQG